jgi:hypothetical protein
MNYEAPEMRTLTLQLKGQSETSIVTGDERGFTDSGKLHWKGNDEYPMLEGLPA